MNRPITVVSFAMFLAFGSLSAAAQTAAPVSLGVTVNGELQSPERGELLLREQLARGVADRHQLRAALRDSLINLAVISQDAVKQDLDKLPAVKDALALAQQNALVQAWQQKILQDAQISDANIQAEYDSQVKAMGSQEFQLRHVLLADEKQAQQVLTKIKGGAKFEATATESSLDKTTAAQGGLSEWMPEGRLTPEILSAIKGLRNGQLAAQPVKTESGWQVLRLENKRAFTPASLDAVKPQIRLALAQRQVQARLKALRDNARIN